MDPLALLQHGNLLDLLEIGTTTPVLQVLTAGSKFQFRVPLAVVAAVDGSKSICRVPLAAAEANGKDHLRNDTLEDLH